MLDELKNELERAYRVLSADNADMCNRRDITVWEKERYINADEARELCDYNRRLYQENIRREKMKYASVTVKIQEMAADYAGRPVKICREHGTIYWGVSDEITAKKLFFEEFPQYNGAAASVKIYQ